MAKAIFAISSLYFLIYGVRAWSAVFAGDHYGVQATNNTIMVSGSVALISFYFIIKDKL